MAEDLGERRRWDLAEMPSHQPCHAGVIVNACEYRTAPVAASSIRITVTLVLVTVAVTTSKRNVDEEAGMRTLVCSGPASVVSSLASKTVHPPDGAGSARVAVQATEVPPFGLVDVQVTAAIAG